MDRVKPPLIGVAALLLALAGGFLLWPDPRPRVEMPLPMPNESIQVADTSPLTRSTTDEAKPLPGSAIEETVPADCTPLGTAERERLLIISRDWYGKLGDASARRYWPYQTIDNETLQKMTVQFDAEAMFQLGMNFLWQATRTEGDHWEPQETHLSDTTPVRDEVDEKKLTLARRSLFEAVLHGKVFANRELISIYKNRPELAGSSRSPSDQDFTAQEVRDARIAMLALLENYRIPELPTQSMPVELNARTEELAHERAAGIHSFLFSGGRGGSSRFGPAHPLRSSVTSPPDAVYRLAEDDRCVG